MQETHCTLTIQAPVDLQDAFVQAAQAENMEASQIILDFMQEYVRRVQANKQAEREKDTKTIKQTSFTREEISILLEKALQASKERNYEEYERIAKTLPITPTTALTFQYLYGVDYLVKEGYNISQLKFDNEGYAIR